MPPWDFMARKGLKRYIGHSFVEEPLDGLPHLYTTGIGIAIGVAYDFDVTSQWKAWQDQGTRFVHRGLRLAHDRVNGLKTPLHEQRIMDHGIDLNTAFNGQTTREAHHLCGVGLRGEIPECPRVDIRADV